MGGSRIEMPAGLATVVGAVPERLRGRPSKLPSAPPVELGAGDALRAADDFGALATTVVPFLRAHAGREAPVVLSMTGPVTLDADLRRLGSGADEAAALATATVAGVGAALIEAARSRLPEAPILLWLAEPALANSMHPTFPLASGEITRLVRDAVRGMGGHPLVAIGVHVAGRADWAALLDTGITLLGAPVTGHVETAAAELADFLRAGGVVAWGAVPVDEPLGQSPERLWRRLSELWCELARQGVDPLVLRERSIITPSGGLAGFQPEQAERIVELTEELATRVLHQTIGVRLSIGA